MNNLNQSDSSRDEIIAAQMAALANPTRLKILRWLAQHEQCQCKDVVDAIPLAQSTISQHLKVLSHAGLVTMELNQPRSHYKLNREALSALERSFGNFVETCCVDVTCEPRSANTTNKSRQ